jgi:hypothetical protein
MKISAAKNKHSLNKLQTSESTGTYGKWSPFETPAEPENNDWEMFKLGFMSGIVFSVIVIRILIV